MKLFTLADCLALRDLREFLGRGSGCLVYLLSLPELGRHSMFVSERMKDNLTKSGSFVNNRILFLVPLT